MVLSRTPLSTSTSLPTQPTIIIMTPDSIQIEKWKEYQTELAKLILSDSGAVFPFYETALCEWDILGRSGQEVYVWAECAAPGTTGGRPAVIYLEPNGSIQKVDVPAFGSALDANIQKLFPPDVQGKIYMYFSSLDYGRANELKLHLEYRLTHPEEPPLFVLSATN